jgi:hypothetical protein
MLLVQHSELDEELKAGLVRRGAVFVTPLTAKGRKAGEERVDL